MCGHVVSVRAVTPGDIPDMTDVSGVSDVRVVRRGIPGANPLPSSTWTFQRSPTLLNVGHDTH